MISVSSRDGMEVGGGVLGVGRGTGGDELEEGEAFSFRDGDDEEDDRIIDPDVALSYIDEKIKNLLGHVQKDFEGGISAENLGGKVGGYGSFLPMYQRSIAFPHSKNPIQVNNQSVLSPPRRPLPEGIQFPPTFSSSPSHIRQHYTSSCNIIRTRDHNSPPSRDNVPVKVMSDGKSADVCNSALVCYKNISPRNENDRGNPADQKMLKLRIKVGSDNIFTKKNAEIYSGLGLDVSPSSSLGSPHSERLPQEPQALPCVSPVIILQIMTTFLDAGERMLSPLSDDLLYLIRKENTYKEDNEIFNKGNEHFTPIVRGGATPIHDDGKISREKRSKTEKKSTPGGLENVQDVQNKIKVLPKEMTTDQTSQKKQVSDFSTFQISTNTHFDHKGPEKSIDDEFLFNMESSEGTESYKLAKEGLCYPNRELNFSGNIGENKRLNAPSDISTPPLKNAYIYTASDSLKTSLNRKELRNTNHENVDHPKQKQSKKISRHGKDGMRESSKEHHGGSNKSRKPLGVDSSTSFQNKNKFHLDGYQPKEKSEYTNKQNPTTNSHNGYSNFSEEPNIGEDDELGSLKLFSDDREEDNEMTRNIPTKENVNNKNAERSVKYEASMWTSTSAGSIGGDRSNVDAPLGAVVPAIIKENWVCCDKCQTWRLLPPNTNPEDLPEKWLCSMLNWLPGMNRCSFSEDETTQSLLDCYYQAPNANMADSHNCDPNHKNNNHHAFSNEVKKKNTTKNTVGTTTNEENTSFSTHPEKVSNATGRSRSLNDEKHKLKIGEKRRMHSHSSNHDIQLTTKSKRVLDNDYSIIVEQPEECMNVFHGDSISGNPNMKKANSISDNGFSSSAMGKSGHGNIQSFPKDSKFGTKDGTEAFAGKRKPRIYLSSTDQSVNFEKVENTGVSNKKKGKLVSVNGVNSGPPPAEGNRQLNGNNVSTKEETSDVVRVKEKKQKYMKSEIMESSGVKDNVIRTNDVCLKHRKVDQVRNISAPLHNSVLPSSPSKSKRSHKSKMILREHKSSPVGTISSSPLMISNPDKAASSHKKIQRNPDFKDATVFVDSGSTGKCSLDDEFSVRNNPLRLSRTEKNENSAHTRSVASPVLDFREVNNNQLPAVPLAKHRSENPYEFTSPNIPSYSKKASGSLDREQVHEHRPQEKLNEMNKKSSDQMVEEKKRRLLIEDPDGENKNKFPAGYDPEIASENPVEGRSSKRSHFDEKSTELTGNGKSHSFPATSSGNAKLVHCQQQNESKSEKPIIDKRSRRDERQNRSKKAYESVCGSDNARDPEIRGFVKKEVSSQVINNALGEAKNLKHVADRLKNSGLENESRGIYFQAALKFLHSASMSESCSDNSNQSIELYKSTAKFCQFCAHEFERAKDMASVALAYKCTEVASLRVIYFSYTTASRDCHELQMAPLTIIPGESPCSSASDVDNVNNNLTADKVAPSKNPGSPQVLGNHVIAARNRPNFLRLLNFSQDVQFAMDCSRRSQAAFATAVAGSDESGKMIDGFSEIKKALDFGFQDVDEILHLIRVAVEAMVQEG